MRLRKKAMLALAVLSAAVLVGAVAGSAATSTNLGDVTVSSNGTVDSGHFNNVWDLTAGDITISATYDATGMVDTFGWNAHAYAELGVRSLGTFNSPDFNPNWPYSTYGGTTTLVSGSKLDPVGTVTVEQVGTELYVTYLVTKPGCYLTETHIAVATAPTDFPQAKGNAVPGQFAYSQLQPAGTTEYTSPGIDAPATGDFYVAAHAKITCSGKEASAWGNGLGFPGKDWSMYFELESITETGAGVWLATDYDGNVGTFGPDVPTAIADLDDKLTLQRSGGLGEGAYDLPQTPNQPGNNYGFWFDRDGVDQFQALLWGAIDGGTYNTAGLYDVVITLHATSATAGTAYMTVNGVPQGFYDGPWFDGQPLLYPVGTTWTGDMEHLQVFYGIWGYGATHSATFNDITVAQ